MEFIILIFIILEFRSSNICFKVYDVIYIIFFSEEVVRLLVFLMTKFSIEMENYVF